MVIAEVTYLGYHVLNVSITWYIRNVAARTETKLDDRLLPPLAEACYLRRDYAGARAALAQFSSRSPLPLLRPLLRYWTS